MGIRVLHTLVYGKTGCRRGVEGQYIASDPKGRAIMVSAIEKRKLVYVTNRDTAGNLTIASPLGAHRSDTLTYDTVGIDNGFQNPIFAALETTYPEMDTANDVTSPATSSAPTSAENVTKQLVYYELDLGLNHVTRRWTAPVHRTANRLAALPGAGDGGPGGVLVCGEDWIEHRAETKTAPAGRNSSPDPPEVAVALPRRRGHPRGSGVLITCVTVHRQRARRKRASAAGADFFVLVQTELGDVFKITVDTAEGASPAAARRVTGLTASLLDTLPVAAGLAVTRLGLLFVAAESGDHGLYMFDRIVLTGAPTCTSAEVWAARREHGAKAYKKRGGEAALAEIRRTFYTPERCASIACEFVPTRLQSLLLVDSVENLSVATGVLVGELAGGEVSPQIYTLCGTGPRSSLRILRHGLAVTELAVSSLPGIPGSIYTIASPDTGHDRYIVVSFADATLVLSIGDTVEEVNDSGFLTDVPTLACAALADGGMVQIHPGGVRHIKDHQAKEWQCPGLKRIERAAANSMQVIIALAGGEINYFELDVVSGILNEMGQKVMGLEVECLDVGPVPPGRARSLFCAAGCRDDTVRILSLSPGQALVQRSSHLLPARPYSVALAPLPSEPGRDSQALSIGLENGSAVRSALDPVTGAMGAPSARFLGARPVCTARAAVGGSPCTVLLSSRPWICRSDGAGKTATVPLSYTPLDHACAFRSEAIPEGIVATAGETLRIVTVELASEGAFNQTCVPLRYTPRGVSHFGENIVLVESEANDLGTLVKESFGFDGSGKQDKKAKDNEGEMDIDSDDDEAEKDEEEDEDDDDDEEKAAAMTTPVRGPVPSKPGTWASCIRLLSPSSTETLDCLELSGNEAAMCCSSVQFASRGAEVLLAVGTVTGMTHHPLSHKAAHVHLYRHAGGKLVLLHKTPVEGVVAALAHFQGKLLVGVGNALRLYEMGKKQLLLKCEFRGIPTMVKTMQTAGDRAYVGDIRHGMHFLRYDPSLNRLILLANDAISRCVTCQELLDFDTLATADKFGNISILRLPSGAELGNTSNAGPTRTLWDVSALNRSTSKLEMLCHYHVGEIVTGMTRASLVAGGAEALIYTTVAGRIGALLPFASRDDVDFYREVEARLRAEAPRPTGRDPQAFRSYYVPVKQVFDGDFCDGFAAMPHAVQEKIAEALDRSVAEVLKKLEDTRNGLL